MMKASTLFLVVFLLFNLSDLIEGKKKSKKKQQTQIPSAELKCLVCNVLSEEIDAYIEAIDPNKKTETGTFRIDTNGKQGKKIIPFARSQESLYEMTDKICDRFSDYVQATEKTSGKYAVIALTTPKGNMNPDFGKFDVLPDDELNKKLAFHCQSIIEELEEDIIDLYSVNGAQKLGSKLCSQFCSKSKQEL